MNHMGAARRTSPRSLATGILALGAAGGLLSGCAAAVKVTPPAPASAVPSCAAAMAALPPEVGGQERRDTTPVSGLTAAWGDPAVIAVCGVAAPGPTTQPCLSVDGADWVVQDLADGARFTTFGRDPALRLLVPERYAPEPLVLPAFGAAARALPSNGRSCS